MCKQFFKAKVWSLLHPLCNLEQRGVRADDSRLQKFLASKYLSFRALRLSTDMLKYNITCFSMRSRSSRKDTFILQKHSLFFAHCKEMIFIK